MLYYRGMVTTWTVLEALYREHVRHQVVFTTILLLSVIALGLMALSNSTAYLPAVAGIQ
jgi:hypothetical protein